VVSPAIAKKIVSGEPIPEVGMRGGIVHLILIQIKDDNLDEVEGLLASASDILMRREFTITSVTALLIVATCGFPFRELENPKEICKQTAKELTDSHFGKLKVLYAAVAGRIGLYGHPKIKWYGPLLPKFDLMLKQLVELNYGESAEYRQ